MEQITSKEPSQGQTKKLLEWWKEEIRSGVKYRQLYGQSKAWRAYKTMYRGIWAKGVVPVNMIYAVGRSLIPQVYFKNPRVHVAAMKPGFTPHAMVLEQLDNYFIRSLGIKNTMKSNILDSYLCGVGPSLLGYDSEYGFNPSFTTDSRYQDSGLTSFGKKEQRIEYTDNIVPGMPWVERCNPEDFIVPWGTSSWATARWYAHRKMRTVSDIKEDPKYKGITGLRGIYHTKLEGSVDGTDRKPVSPDKDETSEWVELWEIHDKRSGRMFVLTLDHDKFLRDEVDFLQLGNLNAQVLGFNEDPDFFWWAPDARLIQVQQEEINDIRTMARKHRRVGLLKMLYDKNALKGDELSKFLDSDVKAAAGIDVGASGDIRKMVAFLQTHVPPDLISYAREVREDVREVVGFSRNQMGSFEQASGRRTAHEAAIVQSASMIRIDERRDIMADHLEQTIRGINKIVFSQWGAERVIDLVGPDGARYWVRFTGKEIQGEFAYHINPEEALPMNQQTRRADAEKFMEIGSKIPGFNMPYVMREWAKQFDWLDYKQLMPQSEGAGRSPEKAFLFNDFARRVGAGTSSFPGLGSA